jgi:histone H2A
MSSPRRASPKKTGGAKKKATSRSSRAGLTFPVGRVAALLKAGRYASRVGKGAPVFITSVLEYLVSELVDIAGANAKEHHKKRLTPRYITLAIRNDEELSRLFHNATISGGGVAPKILDAVKGKKEKKSRRSRSKSGKKSRKSSKGKKSRSSSKDKADKAPKEKKEKSKSKSKSKSGKDKKAKKEKPATQTA